MEPPTPFGSFTMVRMPKILSSVRSAAPILALAGLLVATGGLLAGCGGGGGGSSTGPAGPTPLGSCSVVTANGSLAYNTNWGTAPTNASQVLQILDRDGSAIRSDSLNRNGAATSSINITGVTAGSYRLRITQYSGPNATGTVAGVAEGHLDLCRGGAGGTVENVSTLVGQTPTAVTVSVPNTSVRVGSSLPFIATAVRGTQWTFSAPGGFAWSVSGGLGTMDANGRLTATTAGSGQVTATLGGISGAANVTVTPNNTQRGKWTVMVYMNAANDLFTYSDLNVNQMERVASNPDVRFVVQWKQSRDAFPSSSFDGVRRYLVKPDTSSQVVSELVQSDLRDNNGNSLDMGNPQTLNDFVTWAKQNYPADRYVLVLWNHGNGWRRSANQQPGRAFSYDDQYGTAIQTWQIGQALNGHTVDILAWDCSLMQMIEVAYEARAHAQFIAGSEESPPGEGYPYDAVFQGFRDNPDATTSSLSRGFVDGMLNNPAYVTRKITQSVLRTDRLEAVATAVNDLAVALQADLPNLTTVIPTIRTQAQSYSPTSTRVFRDLVDICLRLEASSAVNGPTKVAAANVRAAVANALVWEGHNANSANSNGLSIDFSGSGTFGSSAFDYRRMKFAQDTQWDEWLLVAP